MQTKPQTSTPKGQTKQAEQQPIQKAKTMELETSAKKTDPLTTNSPLQKSASFKEAPKNVLKTGITDLVSKAITDLDSGSTDIPELKVVEHTPEEEAEAALALLLLELTEKETEGDDYEKEAAEFRKILAEWEQEPNEGIIIEGLDAEENDDPMISNFSRESSDSKLTKTTSAYVGPGDEPHPTKGLLYSTVCTPMATDKSKFKHDPALDFDLREQTIEGQFACSELWRLVWVGEFPLYVNERCDILTSEQLELRQKTCATIDKLKLDEHNANIEKVKADKLTFHPSTKLYYGTNCAAYTLEEVTGAFKKKTNGQFEKLKGDGKSPKTYTLSKKQQTLVPLSTAEGVVPRMWVKADTCDIITFAEAKVLGCAECEKTGRNLLLK